MIAVSPRSAKASAPTTTKDLLAPFAQSPFRHIPLSGMLCFFNVSRYTSTASKKLGSEPPKPSNPMLTLRSRVPNQTASIWWPTALKIASRFLTPCSDSIWMMTAAWSLTFSHIERVGSAPLSPILGNQREGGAERDPFRADPNLAADTTYWACSTVST